MFVEWLSLYIDYRVFIVLISVLIFLGECMGDGVKCRCFVLCGMVGKLIGCI